MFGANISKKARQMGTLTFTFPPLLIPIIKQPTCFARLRVHFLLKLSGKYAVTIDDLRTWFKVPEDSYSS